MNRLIKLLSLLVYVDSTRLVTILLTEVSRKLKHALLTRDFKTYTFRAQFSPDQ